MLVIGIIGGVASGKSLVAGQLRDLGAQVIDVDQVGHEVLRDPDVETAIRQRWGDSVFGEDGHVNRAALAQIVFAPPPDGPKQLDHLEQLTHPRIGQRLRRRIEVARDTETTKAVVLDAAVLLKAGWDGFCDKIVFVDTPRDVRQRRCRQRGWSDEHFAAREAAQPSLDIQRAGADVVIDNSVSRQQTQAEIRQFWSLLPE